MSPSFQVFYQQIRGGWSLCADNADTGGEVGTKFGETC